MSECSDNHQVVGVDAVSRGTDRTLNQNILTTLKNNRSRSRENRAGKIKTSRREEKMIHKKGNVKTVYCIRTVNVDSNPNLGGGDLRSRRVRPVKRYWRGVTRVCRGCGRTRSIIQTNQADRPSSMSCLDTRDSCQDSDQQDCGNYR